MDHLSNLVDDIDIDLSENEIDNILNEEEEVDDIEILTEDPLKNFPLHPRASFKLNPESIRDIAEDRQRLELFLQLDKSSNKLPEKVDPLDLLHKKEVQEAAATDKLLKTSLKDKRQYQEAKLPVIQFEELKLISLKIAPPSSINSPLPSGLAVSKTLILIGNRNGQVLVFNHSGQELKTFKSKKGFGQVTCIDITCDEIAAVVGYHFGQVSLWDLKTGKCIRACNTLHSTPVLSISFWGGNIEHVISGELCGRIMMIEYTKAFMSYSISSSEAFYDEVGPVLAIERLVPDPNWPHPTDSANILAIAGTRRVVIVTINQCIQVIYTIERPPEAPEGVNPCICWKRAVGPDDVEAIDHLLALSWGERITLYRLKFALGEGVQIAGYLDTDNEIKALFWLSYEILFVLGKSREIRVISSKEMDRKPGDNGKRAILDETYANRDLAAQSYIKKDAKEQFTYYNTIKCYDRLSFLLGNKDFQKGRLLNWRECIDELAKKNEWLEVLALGIDLYQGKGKKLYGLPRNKNELREILEEVVRKYVKIANIAWVHKISNTIEFCIGIESLELLFNEFFDIFIDQGGPDNMKIFMNTLEPFILTKEIRIIPTPILGKMIGYYLNARLPSVLERIILNLEPSCLDPRHVLLACEEHNLLTTYIFISTNSLTPNYLNPMDRMFKTMEATESKKGKQYLIYKMLWYFRLCLKGQTFPSGKIPNDMYGRAVADICNWIIMREHLQMFLEFDSVTTLNVFWTVFEDKEVARIIEKRLDGAPSFQTIVDSLLCQRELSSFLFHQIANFIVRTALLDYVSLSKEVYMKVIIYQMQEHRFTYSSPIYASNIDEYITNFSFRTDVNLPFVDLSIEEKGSLLLTQLKKCGDLSEAELNTLYKIAELSPYTEVQVYLLEVKKEYLRCVTYFINCQSDLVKKKVFTWLNDVFTKISESDREKLKSEVMNSLGAFVEIDSDLTAKIVTDWYSSNHIQIVRKLDNAPKLQMKYLGELAKESLDEDLVHRYIVLLCQNDPKAVLPFLASREDYNFEECLVHCEEYKVVEAAAYIHEKLGNTQEALNMLLSRAEANKKIVTERIRNREPIPKAITELIHSDIKECIDCCLRNASKLDAAEAEEHWFQVLTSILGLFKDFKELFVVNPVLEPSVHELIQEILEHMMASVDFNKIISFITKNFQGIPFKHFKENICQVLSQHSYKKTIVKQAINLLASDVRGMTKNLYSFRSKGVTSQELCGACKKSMTSDRLYKEKFTIFICGHGFHSRCAREGLCLVCLDNNRKKGELVFSGDKKKR